MEQTIQRERLRRAFLPSLREYARTSRIDATVTAQAKGEASKSFGGTLSHSSFGKTRPEGGGSKGGRPCRARNQFTANRI
jgi:hypothetical protein